MRSGSFNVTYITFGNFTRLGLFCQPFEALTAIPKFRQVAFKSPYPSKLYTKAAPKANPLGSQAVPDAAAKAGLVNLSGAPRFHRA